VLGELPIVAADFGEKVTGQRLAFDIDRSGRADASQDPGRPFSP
jgi:hypothetical protein